MNKFTDIQKKLKQLVIIARECGRFNEMILRFNNLNTLEYDEAKCTIIQEKINELEKEYTNIYFKYFS